MSKPSEPPGSWEEIRDRVIGLGERSTRKSHYPALQRRLREVERFRLLLDRTAEAIVVADLETGKVVDANQSAAERLGREGASLIESRLADLLPETLARELDARREGRPGSSGPLRVNFVGPDQRPFIAEATLHYTTFEGRPFAVLVARDVSARVKAQREADESERKFQTLATAAPVGVFHCDLRGRATYWNQACLRLVGEHRAPISGRAWLRHVHAADLRHVGDAWRNAIRLRQPLAIEFRVRRPGGKAGWVSLQMAPHGGEGGRVLGFVGTASDITESKNLEAALRAAKEAAEFANRVKTQFLANISHEFRTPLNAIIGFSEILQTGLFGSLPAKQREYVSDIHASGLLLLDLVTDILDVARIESGGFEMDDQPVDLAAVIASAVDMVRHRAEASGVSVSVAVAEDLPKLLADPVRIRQVLINLMGNAVKFNQPGGEVAVEARCGGDRSLSVRVSDTGIGIAEADIPRLFRPFEQVSDAMVRSREGVGLGLYISNQIVTRLGGTISLASRLGSGTDVTVCFPPARTLPVSTSRRPGPAGRPRAAGGRSRRA